MNPLHKVLVVANDTHLSATLQSWLRESGCELTLTTTFAAAREYLEAHPAVVIAEVRLGAYNGLHLALRARARGIPTVVLGDTNPITEREAEELGAAYMSSSDVNKAELQSLIEALIAVNSREPDTNAQDPYASMGEMPFRVAWAIATRTSGASVVCPGRFLVH